MPQNACFLLLWQWQPAASSQGEGDLRADKVGTLADGRSDQEPVRGQDDTVLVLSGANQPPAGKLAVRYMPGCADGHVNGQSHVSGNLTNWKLM